MNSKFLSALAIAGAILFVGCSLVPEKAQLAATKQSTIGGTDAGSTADSGPACMPDCSGSECGNDGCGGSCGSCGNYQICNVGLCIDKPDTGSADSGPTPDSGASTNTGSAIDAGSSNDTGGTGCKTGLRCQCVPGGFMSCMDYTGNVVNGLCEYWGGTYTKQYCEGGFCSGQDWDVKINFTCPAPTTAPTEPDCNDGNACTADSYNTNIKACVHTTISCDYGCDAVKGCKLAPNPGPTTSSFKVVIKTATDVDFVQGCALAGVSYTSCISWQAWVLEGASSTYKLWSIWVSSGAKGTWAVVHHNGYYDPGWHDVPNAAHTYLVDKYLSMRSDNGQGLWDGPTTPKCINGNLPGQAINSCILAEFPGGGNEKIGLLTRWQ